MWNALGLWQVGWLVGLLSSYALTSPSMPERVLPTILGFSLFGGIVGALLGSFLVVKDVDEDIVLGLIGKPTRSYSSREELMRSVPGIAMACVALVSLPMVAAYFLGLVLDYHIMVAASVGTWATAWICCGARRLPAGIVFYLLGWTMVSSAAVTWAQPEQLGWRFYLQSELSVSVAIVLGLFILRSFVVACIGAPPRKQDEWG